MMVAKLTIRPDESMWVEHDDRMVPSVRVHYGAAGDTPTVECPECEARIRLDGYFNHRPEVDSFAIHYVTEHVRPAIRYEETSS